METTFLKLSLSLAAFHFKNNPGIKTHGKMDLSPCVNTNIKYVPVFRSRGEEE